MDILLGVLVGIFVLTFVVVLHELGHAVASRRSGVVVKEFGIGFPPKAYGKKLKNGMLFTINWLPLGGFVRLQGENDSDNKKGDYGNATFWQKTKILLAGVIMNWLTAWVAITILMLIGMPRFLPNQFMIDSDTKVKETEALIIGVAEDGVADKTGIQKNDLILAIAGENVDNTEHLKQLLSQNAGNKVDVKYQRNGLEYTAVANLNSGDGPIFDVVLSQGALQSTWSAPVTGLVLTGQFTYETYKGLFNTLGSLFTGLGQKIGLVSEQNSTADDNLNSASQAVAGPVGLVGQIAPAALALGVQGVLVLIALISIALAVMNSLPIPALDGGRWFLTFIYRVVLQKELTEKTEASVHGTGFMLMMALFVLITISDIKGML